MRTVCVADSPLYVSQTGGADFAFSGTNLPPCICPCMDVPLPRKLVGKESDTTLGMLRTWLMPCAEGPSRMDPSR